MKEIDIDQLSETIQRFLSYPPLFVLGSGASAPYGLPTMGALAEAIISDEEIIAAGDTADLLDRLGRGDGLEDAVNKAGIGEASLDRIRCVIWREVNDADRRNFERSVCSDPTPLEVALEKVLRTAGGRAQVVTTNYDRVAEVAIDRLGATCIDGFYGHLLRKVELEPSAIRLSSLRRREKVVELWKVHGSLDWYRADDGSAFSVPFYPEIPAGCTPLIVPPSKEKYAETSQDPYCGVMSKADAAFESARSYLCVGYGFNDTHIHPYLKREAEQGKPIVILARTLTDSCKGWLDKAALKRFVALEKDGEGEGATHVMMNDGWEKRLDYVIDGSYWDFKELVQIW